MKITTARRIAQIFFVGLFVWLCLAATVGPAWWQWRGWPISWFLQLDPLVAVGTVLTTHSFHPLLAWSLVTIALTILVGRVFCGFICPFGAIHQFVGWLGRLAGRSRDKIAANAYRPIQVIKYYVLIAMLAAASGNLILEVVRESRASAIVALGVTFLIALSLLWLTLLEIIRSRRHAVLIGLAILVLWCGAAAFLSGHRATLALLQIGWLDPIPLVYRSFNLFVLPAADLGFERWFPSGRLHAGVWLIGGMFTALVLANLVIPRFFCRVLCPLGALLGVIGRGTLWSIGKTGAKCTDCSLCDVDCEGACNPAGPIRVSECLMCMNCLDSCPTAAPLGYLKRPSTGGEITEVGVSRRGFVATVVGGLVAVPLARVGGTTKSDWSPGLIRPPGSVAEEEFLARCLKCDACIRVCPTNTLQPAGFEHGWEAIWTPVLNNRIGTSGCQLNCIACGHACPTGAIRPLILAEKQGTGEFAERGPVRIGLAYVDRGHCLPWAMERPCIVCEENCPVTPKAITVSETDSTVRDGVVALASVSGTTVRLGRGAALQPGAFASGDYRARLPRDGRTYRILANTADTLTLDAAPHPTAAPPAATGDDAEGAPPEQPASMGNVEIQVRLQRPVVDPSRCIGCGVCEHECPMTGLRAIRVTADNETRGGTHGVLLRAPVTNSTRAFRGAAAGG